MRESMTDSGVATSSIFYYRIPQVFSCAFLTDGFERELIGKIGGDSDIRGIEYSDSLDELMTSLMPFDSSIAKKSLTPPPLGLC